MLMLNLSSYSKTVLVVVDSNTTYVNVKQFKQLGFSAEGFNSNTTYVNVKQGTTEAFASLGLDAFKYNLC